MKRNFTKEFDRHFKDKLSDYSSSLPSDFNSLEEKLNQEYVLDQKANQSLKSLQPDTLSQWQSFRTLLDKRVHWYPRIWRFKILEFTTIILIIFSLVNFLPQPNKLLIPTSTESISSIDQMDELNNTSDLKFEKSKNNSSSSLITESTSHSKTRNNIQSDPTHKRPNILTLAVQSTLNSFSGISELNKQPIVPTRYTNDMILDSYSEQVTEELAINKTPKAITSIRVESIPQQAERLDDNRINTLEPGIESIKNTNPSFSISNVESSPEYLLRKFVGANFSTQVNLENHLGGTHVGYGFGLLMDFECSPRWFIRSNVTVSMARFNDISNTSIAYQSTTLDYTSNINTHLVSISLPVTANYIFHKDEKWRIYAGAGVSFCGIMSKTYSGVKSHQSNTLSIQNQINTHEYEGGLLQGAPANKNYHFGAIVGAGVERHLGSSAAIFIQPSMYLQIFPMASQQTFHQFSVQIGLKTAI